jgi:surface protein
MFAECSKLNLNDVTAWSKYNTANVTTMKAMFKGCAAMTYLKLTLFNTAKVKNMESMFSGCKSLKTLIVGSGFSAASLVGNQSGVFTGVTGLTIKMPSSVYENRSTIFTTKLGFKSTNGSMIEN